MDDAQTKLDLAKSAFDNTANRQYQTVSGSGLAQAQAQVNSIKVQISNSTISSPISGVVTNRNINSGEMARWAALLMSIADRCDLKLQGNVSQEDVVRLTGGRSPERGRGRDPRGNLRGKDHSRWGQWRHRRAVLPRCRELEKRRPSAWPA